MTPTMHVSLPPLEINTGAEIQARQVDGDTLCLIVDDFLANPGAMVDFAVANAEHFEVPTNSYPGHVLDIAPKSTGPLQRYIRREMRQHFPFLRSGLELMTLMSMTTLQPSELSNLQRLCHTDPKSGGGRSNYAGLLYLFDDETLGGTGFYRWHDRKIIEQATAFELQDPAKALEFLKERFPTYNEAPCYITESNEIAELIDMVPARYNRWIFYSGDTPHSAFITSPHKLSKDFSKGRLTLNCFASVVSS